MKNIRKTIRKTAVAALLAGSLAGTSAIGGLTALAATAGTAETETAENSKSRLNSAERPEKPQFAPEGRASGNPKGQTDNQAPEKPEGEAQQNLTIGKITAISGNVLTVEVMKGQDRNTAPEGERKEAPEGEQKEAPEFEQKEAPEGKQAGAAKENQQTDSAAARLTPPEKPEEKKSESSEAMTGETMTTETVTVTVEDASAYAVGDMVEITYNDSDEVSGVAKAEAPGKADGQQKEASGNTPGKASENTTEQAAA